MVGCCSFGEWVLSLSVMSSGCASGAFQKSPPAQGPGKKHKAPWGKVWLKTDILLTGTLEAAVSKVRKQDGPGANSKGI